jgi:polysaccharide pyruvyl transferase WcaK-like protein
VNQPTDAGRTDGKGTAVRILIHNSDSPDNRGDRAILAGVIELARRQWPGAEIWSLSTHPERDEAWFGIRFATQSPYSTNPIEWLRLRDMARRSDVVLWGGGEIMKDYTNRLGLVYWEVKLAMLSRVNRAIVGAFQGIGPTAAESSRRRIRRTVDYTRLFFVRDQESHDKLVSWGARTPVIASYDPAVLLVPADWDEALEARVAAATGLRGEELSRAIGFGVRRWFHYQRGGLIPVKFRFWQRGRQRETSPEFETYVSNLAEVADRLIERDDCDILFFPMHIHPSEGDAGFARQMIERMRNPGRAVVIETDEFSPSEFAAIMGRMRLFVASRLHSAILATLAGVPSFVLYYVDKGRLYFEQLGMERWSAPIEDMLRPDAADHLEHSLEELAAAGDAVRVELSERTTIMGARIREQFADGITRMTGEAPKLPD